MTMKKKMMKKMMKKKKKIGSDVTDEHRYYDFLEKLDLRYYRQCYRYYSQIHCWYDDPWERYRILLMAVTCDVMELWGVQ